MELLLFQIASAMQASGGLMGALANPVRQELTRQQQEAESAQIVELGHIPRQE